MESIELMRRAQGFEIAVLSNMAQPETCRTRNGMPKRSIPRFAIAIALSSVLAVAGCSSTHDGEVDAVARQFETAVQATPGRACGLLAEAAVADLESEGTDCPAALAAIGMPGAGALRSVQVFGTQAQARFDGDVIFLEDFEGAWVVTAAGCVSRASLPYDCKITKG